MRRVRGLGADPAQDLEPVDARQLQVEQDHSGASRRVAAGVGAAAEQVIQRLLPVAATTSGFLIAFFAKRPLRQRDVAGVVLDQQYRLLNSCGLP